MGREGHGGSTQAVRNDDDDDDDMLRRNCETVFTGPFFNWNIFKIYEIKLMKNIFKKTSPGIMNIFKLFISITF